jgi:hypothetical protein
MKKSSLKFLIGAALVGALVVVLGIACENPTDSAAATGPEYDVLGRELIPITIPTGSVSQSISQSVSRAITTGSAQRNANAYEVVFAKVAPTDHETITEFFTGFATSDQTLTVKVVAGEYKAVLLAGRRLTDLEGRVIDEGVLLATDIVSYTDTYTGAADRVTITKTSTSVTFNLTVIENNFDKLSFTGTGTNPESYFTNTSNPFWDLTDSGTATGTFETAVSNAVAGDQFPGLQTLNPPALSFGDGALQGKPVVTAAAASYRSATFDNPGLNLAVVSGSPAYDVTTNIGRLTFDITIQPSTPAYAGFANLFFDIPVRAFGWNSRPSAVTWHVRNGIDPDNLERGAIVAGGYTSGSIAGGILLGVNIPLIEVSGSATLGPVLGIDTTTLAYNNIDFTWPTIAGATAYKLYTSSDNIAYTGATGPFTSPYTLNPLPVADGTRNWYKLTATIGGVEVWSQAIIATNATTVILDTTGPAGVIGLDWTLAPVYGASWYNIYRSTASGTLGTLVAKVLGTPGVETYSDTGLVSGTTYYYTVSAEFADGTEGVKSAQVDDTAP